MRGRRPTHRLEDYLESLHSESVTAVANQDLALFRRAMDTYGDILITYPREWARYGQRFVGGIADELDLVPGPLDQLFRALVEEMRLCLSSGSSEFVKEALSLAFRTLSESVGLRAHALWTRMLRHLRYTYELASEPPDSPAKDRAADLSVRYQFEIGRYYVGPLVEDEAATLADRRDAVDFVSAWFDELAELLRVVVESHKATDLARLNDQWSQVFEYWQPELEGPTDFDVERIADELGDDSLEARSARDRLSVNREMASLRERLLLKREALRLALLWWALRVWQAEDHDAQATFLAQLDVFADLPSLASAVIGALEWEADELPPWNRWELSGLAEGRAHALASDIGLLGAYLTATLVRGDEPVTPDLFVGLDHRIANAIELLPGLQEDTRLTEMLGPDLLTARVDLVHEALQQAAERRASEEAAALRSASLSPEKVDVYIREVRGSWQASRVLAPMFNTFGRLEVLLSPVPLGEGKSWFGRNELLPKSLFTDVREVGGLEQIAQQMGQSLTLGEVARFIEMLEEAGQVAVQELNPPLALAAASAEMAPDYSPAIALIPISWPLERELGVGRFRGTRTDTDELLLAGERREHWYRGKYGEIHVVRSTSVPGDKMLLVDLPRWGSLQQWTIDDAGIELAVEVDTFDRETAAELLRVRTDLFPGDDEEARINALLERVRSRILERFEIKILDPRAARFVALPDEFRGQS